MDAFIKHEGISAFQLFIITSPQMIFKTIINNFYSLSSQYHFFKNYQALHTFVEGLISSQPDVLKLISRCF